MPRVSSSELISALYSDTCQKRIEWKKANVEANNLYPTIDIIRAFKTNIDSRITGTYFIAIEYIVNRYDPDFDFMNKESAYFVAFVSDGVVGEEFHEQGFPLSADIKELVEEIAFRVSGASTKIRNFLRHRKDSEHQQ